MDPSRAHTQCDIDTVIDEQGHAEFVADGFGSGGERDEVGRRRGLLADLDDGDAPGQSFSHRMRVLEAGVQTLALDDEVEREVESGAIARGHRLGVGGTHARNALKHRLSRGGSERSSRALRLRSAADAPTVSRLA